METNLFRIYIYSGFVFIYTRMLEGSIVLPVVFLCCKVKILKTCVVKFNKGRRFQM